jgi:hypothetical protein
MREPGRRGAPKIEPFGPQFYLLDPQAIAGKRISSLAQAVHWNAHRHSRARSA